MREKYPKIYHENTDTSVNFDRNRRYIYYPSPNDKTSSPHSPWYAFEMINATSSESELLLDNTFDLLNFLNWAIYYHEVLTTDYNAIPKDPKPEQIKEAIESAEVYAHILKKELSKSEKEIIEKNLSKKNHFILKPTKFLKLCRFFARGWYEEHIDVIGSVKFAHYITNYIINKGVKNPICPYYDANNENQKKEVSRLFKEENEYKYKGFQIKLTKHINNENQSTYTISILHYESKSMFFLSSRLYLSHYTSQIKGRK